MNLDVIMVLKTKMNPEGDMVMSELIVQGFSDQFQIHEFENPTVFRGEELIKAPTSFKMTIIVPVPKNSKIECLDNYYPVALTFTIMKFFKSQIFFILLLICQLSQVTACDTDKYEHDGVCCSSCLTRLGLQIKQNCTETNDTICKPRKGHYCVGTNCQMAKKHTSCPAGQGVKKKGTQLNDTVCEMCPAGMFSRNKSSTEACMNWTVCEKLHRQLFEPGSSEADVKCAEANNNLRIIIPVIAIAVIIFILIGAVVFWRYPKLRPCFKKRRKNGIGWGDNPSPAGNHINVNDSESTSMPLRSKEQPECKVVEMTKNS
ncbi:uncharacterized protein LOC144607895 [Rhinoraja longicauda]